MRIRSIVHKGLRYLYESDDPKGLPAAVDKLRKMLAFLDAIASEEEVPQHSDMEGPPVDRQPPRHLEPARVEELAPHVRDRGGRDYQGQP